MEPAYRIDEPISVYTRADALSKGLLIDVSGIAVEEGIAVPVALTATAFRSIGPSVEERCQGIQLQVRLREMFRTLRDTLCKRSYIEASSIDLGIVLSEGGKRVRQDLVAVLHRGERDEPVLTIMLQSEDWQ